VILVVLEQVQNSVSLLHCTKKGEVDSGAVDFENRMPVMQGC
jgi:hypothetical protein